MFLVPAYGATNWEAMAENFKRLYQEGLTKITELTDQVNTLTKDNERLQRNYAGLEASVDEYKKINERQHGEILVLENIITNETYKEQAKIDQLKKKVNRLENKIDKQNDQIDKLENKRANKNNQIQALQGEMETMKTQMAEMETLPLRSIFPSGFTCESTGDTHNIDLVICTKYYDDGSKHEVKSWFVSTGHQANHVYWLEDGTKEYVYWHLNGQVKHMKVCEEVGMAEEQKWWKTSLMNEPIPMCNEDGSFTDKRWYSDGTLKCNLPVSADGSYKSVGQCWYENGNLDNEYWHWPNGNEKMRKSYSEDGNLWQTTCWDEGEIEIGIGNEIACPTN